ncbi:MAG TPA: 50S ribosomal protein L29 [Chloroflexota bacterium]|jgi:large subunit ribosomal protein L29|nr:50S ribosomal protein L29 [Chloroflexota bacterium]
MKMSELRDLDREQLEAKLRELHEEMFNLRFQVATHQLTNTARIREVRRDVARVKTALAQVSPAAAGAAS